MDDWDHQVILCNRCEFEALKRRHPDSNITVKKDPKMGFKNGVSVYKDGARMGIWYAAQPEECAC